MLSNVVPYALMPCMLHTKTFKDRGGRIKNAHTVDFLHVNGLCMDYCASYGQYKMIAHGEAILKRRRIR